MKAAIFDMDGTLIDSMWIWNDIDIAYAKKHNYRLTQDQHLAIAHMTLMESCAYFKELANIQKSTEEIRSEILDMARDYYQTKVTMKPFAIDYIRFLRNKGIKTAIATASPKEFADIVLDRFSLRKEFDVVLTACDVSVGKREPEIFNRCATLMSVSNRDTTVFEDALHAAQTAKKAGFRVVGITDPYCPHQETLPLHCDQMVNSWQELL